MGCGSRKAGPCERKTLFAARACAVGPFIQSPPDILLLSLDDETMPAPVIERAREMITPRAVFVGHLFGPDAFLQKSRKFGSLRGCPQFTRSQKCLSDRSER